MSPIRLYDPDDGPRLTLERLYDADDLLFIGGARDRGVPGSNIRPVREWLQHPGRWPQFVIPNPLTGAEALTKTGAPSFRCDNAIRDHRFAVVEFDDKPIELQAGFWADMIGRGLPVACVVHSGGRSLHGWVCCPAEDVGRLFRSLTEIGADPMTRNASRMSRLPGAWRDNGKRQTLYYLNPEARP